MKKAITIFLLLLLSASAFSQANSLEELSQEVNQMVSAYGDTLDADDQLSVRKNLRQILQIFKMNGNGLPTGGSYICDSNTNQLFNLDGRTMIYDFSSAEHCQEALINVKKGKSFCDYNDNTLRLADGRLVHDFSESANCKDAVESIFKVKMFCDYRDNTLRKIDGSLLYDFSSKEECLKGLN